MTTLDDKLLGEKLQNYCSSSEDDEEEAGKKKKKKTIENYLPKLKDLILNRSFSFIFYFFFV